MLLRPNESEGTGLFFSLVQLLQVIRSWLFVKQSQAGEGPFSFQPDGDVCQRERGTANLVFLLVSNRPMAVVPFWLVSEFTTHFKTYFSGWIGMFTGGSSGIWTHGLALRSLRRLRLRPR